LTFNTDTQPGNPQDIEPNNSIATASAFIEDGGTVDGRMGYEGFGISDGTDYYGLVLPDDGNITVSGVIDSTLNASIAFFYKNGQFLSQTAVTTGDIELSRSCLAQDTVYLRTLRSSGCGSYSLTFTTDTPPANPQDIEPNNSIATASTFIADGETVDGRMGYEGFGISDSEDWYGLELPDDGNITVSGVIDSTLNAIIIFYYKNGQLLSQTAVTTGDIELSRSCLAQDTVYLRTLRSSGCGSYSLTFTTDTPPANPQDIEPNNSIATASAFIEDGGTVGGRMGYEGVGISDGTDYYGLVLPDDGTITVSGVIDSTLNASIGFFYKNGTFLSQTAVTTGDIVLSRSCMAQDTVYLRTLRSSGCGSYSLQYNHVYPTYSQDAEPNNSVATATVIENAPSYEGHLGYDGFGISDPFDYYRFTVTQAPFQLDAKVEMVDGLNGNLALFTGAGSFLGQTATQTGSFSYQQTLTTAGEYVLRVGRSSGCGSYALGDLCGEYPDTPIVSADGPIAFCEGGDVNLSSSPEVSYEWSTGATTQSINVNTSGDYSVTVKDLNGCPAESATTSVTVFPLPAVPTVTASGPTTFCAGSNVTLTSSAATSYLWSTGATSQSITVSTTGNYSVTVTDANGCSRTSSATSVVRNPLPGVPTVTASGPSTFCAGGSVTLTSSAAPSYLWSNGATTQSITVSASGSFSVTVTNANGCSRTSANTTVTVNPLPAVPTITASGPTTFCAGESVTLTSSAAASYLWSNGATTQSITVSASGSFSVTVTNANGCSRSSANTTVTVNPLPSIPTITADGPTTFCDGQSVTLTSSAQASYLWSTGATTQSIVVTSSGSYSVTVSTASGCSASSSSTTVTVQPNSTWYADTDGDGFGDSGNPLSFCTQPAGYVSNDLDCDDTNEFIFPGAEEICGNDIDDDCDGDVDEDCPTCDLNNICTDLDVVEIGFGTANARVNATWTNPNGTTDCEVRGGRISPSSIGTGNPQFANINNTRIITQTNGSTVLFNIVLYNNPNVPFTVGQTYGYEVRCLCEDETAYTNWSGITPAATFVVPSPPASLQEGLGTEAKFNEETKVAVYPNPSNGEEINLSITGSELDNAFIRIMDMNGKLISESRLDRDVKSGQMNLRFDSRLDRGVYLIQLYNDTQMINQRFIVE
jgi:hypothetical protein